MINSRALWTAAAGTARVFVATARGMALDVTAGAARAGEVAIDAVAGRGARSAAGQGAGSGAAGEARPTSTVRVEVLILSDEHGVPVTTADRLERALTLADRTFTEHARLHIRCSGVRTIAAPAPTTALDPRADRALLVDEIVGRTAFYRDHLAPRPALGVVGDPVTVIVVRSIAGRATGCSLGMTADWVVVEASLFDQGSAHTYDETVLAHELGHALNLPHHPNPANLMSPVSSPPNAIRGTALSGWQAAVLQANRHTIPPARPARSSG